MPAVLLCGECLQKLQYLITVLFAWKAISRWLMQMGKSLVWGDARLLAFAAAAFPGTSLFATERMAVKALIPFVRRVICPRPHRSRNR